ncbi:MAG TPA: phenylacetate--CoA ligase family protein [Rhodanobacteraceae bacterium]|nr:phenylacetate--CoA ligase family protein [Rhodanobacteraceae bacterium]
MAVYEQVFRRVLYPLWESGLRRRGTLRYLAEYEANQWLSPEALDALQWRKLQALLAHCWEQVPYYRERWRALGITAPEDIRKRQDFARLPSLTKADIRDNFQALQASNLHGQVLYKNTGGSTGVPLRFGYTRESNDRRSAVMWRGYGWAGARMGRRALFLWGGAVGDPSRAHLVKDRLYHAAFNRRIVNTFDMTEANMARYADAIDRAKPDIIVAYVGPLVRLGQWLLATGRRVHAPVSLLGAAEPLYEFQRDIIERAFGGRMYNTYGCREFMLVASECGERDGLHVNADHLLVETDSANGGELAITDLHNYGMPFIRYVNGDLATPMPGQCACGRGLPRLAHIDGRKLDALRTAQGHLLPGEFFPHMLKDVAGLRQYQVVQQRLDRLDISLVRGNGFEEGALDYIRREVAKVVGDAWQLDFHFVEHIAPNASGKFRVTRCELPVGGEGVQS